MTLSSVIDQLSVPILNKKVTLFPFQSGGNGEAARPHGSEKALLFDLSGSAEGSGDNSLWAQLLH